MRIVWKYASNNVVEYASMPMAGPSVPLHTCILYSHCANLKRGALDLAAFSRFENTPALNDRVLIALPTDHAISKGWNSDEVG